MRRSSSSLFFSALPWLAVAALAIIQLRALPGDYLGYEHDDAEYVLASLSMLRGEYRLGISPGNPPLVHLTPGLPCLLLPAALAYRGEFWPFHLTAWALLAVCDALMFLWLSRRLGRWEALACVVAFCINPLVLARAGKVMPEIPMLAAILGLFVLLDNPEAGGWAAGGIVAAACLIRQRALALIPVVFLWYWVKRKKRADAFASLAAPAAVFFGWKLWLAMVRSGAYEHALIREAYAGGVRDLPRVLAANARYYCELWGRLWLARFPSEGPLELLAGAGLLALCVLGAARILRKRAWEPSMLWLISAGIFYAALPFQFERYLLIFLPMLIWALWEGLAVLAPKRNIRLAGLSAVLAAQFATQGIYALSPAARLSRPRLAETYAWIRSNLPKGAAFASVWYATDALYTGHPAGPLPEPLLLDDRASASKGGSLAQRLRDSGYEFVLMQDTDVSALGSSLRYNYAPVRELAALHAALSTPPFSLEYRNEAEGATVYRIRGQ